METNRPKTHPMKNRLFCVCIITVAINTSLNSQHLRKPLAATYTGLGAYSVNHTDVFSFTSNQASLAQLKKAELAMFSERKFLLNELSHHTAVFGLPTGSGNFGLKGCFYGFSDYNETQLGLAYARKLSDKIDLGAQFNYNGIKVSGYGNSSAISFELGTILHLTDELHAGFHINNPVGGKFGKDQQEKLASVYTFGMGYEASEKFFVSTEIIKEEEQPVNVNTGIQYKFLPQLLARIGMSTAASTGWMGFGFFWKSLRLDIAAAYHPQLGITPGLLLLYNFKAKEN